MLSTHVPTAVACLAEVSGTGSLRAQIFADGDRPRTRKRRCLTPIVSDSASDTVLNVKRQLAKTGVEVDPLAHDGIHDVHELVH